jgi:type IV pilus assembly protein PilX
MKHRSLVVPGGRQAGVVLIIALIALAAMTLAGIALVRSMDTGLVISGNLAFKQATLNVAERGTEQAVAWLQANATTLATAPNPTTDMLLWYDSTANGYYATYMDICDLTGNRTSPTNDDVNWKDADHIGGTLPGANCGMTGFVVAGMPVGYSASYVINRMCSVVGRPGTAVPCAQYQGPQDEFSKSTKRGAHYPERPLSAVSGRYFRITTRVLGPRNAVSYAQALVGL